MTRPLPLLAAVLLLALPSVVAAQSLVYEEAFETNGNPARYTTSVPEAITSGSSSSDALRNYFTRSDGSNVNTSQVVLLGADGFFFAAQDVDDATGTNPVSLTIPTIDISTVTSGLELRATYAEDDQTSGGVPNEAWDSGDNVKVYASIDGATEVLIFAIESSSSSESNTAPRVDTDFDGVGDGTEITPTFSQLTAPIAGTGGSLTLRFEFNLNGDNEDIAVDDISIYGFVGAGQVATVAFSSAGAPEIAEDGGATTVDVVLTTSDGLPLESAVSGTVDVTVGTNDSDVAVTNGAFSFPAASAGDGTAAQTVTVTGTNDADFEGTEAFELGFASLSGAVATSPTTFAFSVLDDDPAPPAPPVRISEVDASTADADGSGDDVEFIEITGPPNYSLDGLVIVLLDGADGLANNDFDLDDCSTDANGVFVIGDEAVVGTTDTCNGGTALTRALFNGCTNCNKLADGPDAVLLFVGNGSDFSNNGDIKAQADAAGAQLFDVYAWGVNKARQEAGMLDVIESFPGFANVVQHDEDYLTDNTDETQSVGRIAIPTPGGIVLSGLFYVQAPSPGVLNGSTLTVTPTQGSTLFNPTSAEDDGAEWRLLAAPVVKPDASAFAVGDLAGLNLVQGVPAGSVFPAEYPGATPNVFLSYTGASYTAPATTDAEVGPGTGFWWYWYDNDVDPSASPAGTSRSFELTPVADGGAFDYSFTGIPVDDQLADAYLGGPLAIPIDVYADPSAGGASRFGMVGNPFAYPYLLGGVSADVGTLSTAFQAYEPGSGFSILIADTADPHDGASIGVAEGGFFEVTGVPEGQTVTLSASSAFVDPTTTDDFNGRLAASDRLALRLTGELADGTPVRDGAAMVRRVEDAVDGWDRHDASKLAPLGPRYALIAPVGTRDGEAYRQAVVSLPTGADAALPLAFKATADGTFTISADALPGSAPVLLRDDVTGTVTDLRGEAYTFTATAADWTDRFTLALDRTFVGTEPLAERATELSLPAPNPTRTHSTVVLTSREASTAHVVLVDALGRTVATLHDGALPAGGRLDLTLETGRFAPGVYVVRARVGGEVHTRSLTVVR